MTHRIDALSAVLLGDESRMQLERMIFEFGEMPEEFRVEIRNFYDRRVQGIVASLKDLIIEDDASEAIAALPSIWLEMRLEWNRYNNQMQYQTVIKGQAEPLLMAQGSCLSYIVELVERSIDSEALFWINRIAIGVIDSVKSRLHLARRFLDLADSLDRGIRSSLEILFQTRDELSNIGRENLQLLDSSIARVTEAYSSSVCIKPEDLHENLLMLIASCLKDLPVRLVFNGGDVDDKLFITPEVTAAFRAIGEAWSAHLLQANLETSLEERLQEKKSPHINVHWNLKRKGRRLFFTIKDDGSKRQLMQFPLRHWSHIGLTLEENSQDADTELQFSCYERSLHEFLVLRATFNGEGRWFGISTTHVVRIEKAVDLVQLDTHRQLLRMQGVGEVPIVELTSWVFGEEADSPEKASYVMLARGALKDALALRVEKVEGILQGALKPGLGLTRSEASQGIVIDGQHLIHVLDMDHLWDLQRGRYGTFA